MAAQNCIDFFLLPLKKRTVWFNVHNMSINIRLNEKSSWNQKKIGNGKKSLRQRVQRPIAHGKSLLWLPSQEVVSAPVVC